MNLVWGCKYLSFGTWNSEISSNGYFWGEKMLKIQNGGALVNEGSVFSKSLRTFTKLNQTYKRLSFLEYI